METTSQELSVQNWGFQRLIFWVDIWKSIAYAMRRISWFQEMYKWNKKITQQISSQTKIHPNKKITILSSFNGMIVKTSLLGSHWFWVFFFEKPWGCSATRGEYDQPTYLPQWGGLDEFLQRHVVWEKDDGSSQGFLNPQESGKELLRLFFFNRNLQNFSEWEREGFWCCRTMRLQTPSYLVGLGIQHLPEIFAANLGKADFWHLQIGRFRTQPGNEGQAKNIQHVWLRDSFVGKENQPTLTGIRKSIRVSLVYYFADSTGSRNLGGSRIFKKMMVDFAYRWMEDRWQINRNSDVWFQKSSWYPPSTPPWSLTAISPLKSYQNPIPNDPITERQMMIGVYNHLLSKAVTILRRWLDP